MAKSITILAFLILLVSCHEQEIPAEEADAGEVQAKVDYERVTTLSYRDISIEVSANPDDRFSFELIFSENVGSQTARFVVDLTVGTPMHLVSASGNKVFFLEGIDLHVFDIENFSHQVVPADRRVGAIALAALTEQDVLLIGYPGPWVLFNVVTGAESTLLGEVLQAYQADDKLILHTLNDQTFAFWPQEEVRMADFSSLQEIPLLIYGNDYAFEVTE